MHTFDENILSDLYKDAYGWRPKGDFWESWKAMNNNEKQAKWEEICTDLENEIIAEKARDEANSKAFENRINKCMEVGAKSREDAIRWIVDSMELTEIDKMYGGAYICYELGIPHKYAKEIDNIIKGK